MNDWKQTQFGKEYDAFRQELDDYYASYPTDVSALEQELDEKTACSRRRAPWRKKRGFMSWQPKMPGEAVPALPVLF